MWRWQRRSHDDFRANNFRANHNADGSAQAAHVHSNNHISSRHLDNNHHSKFVGLLE